MQGTVAQRASRDQKTDRDCTLRTSIGVNHREPEVFLQRIEIVIAV